MAGKYHGRSLLRAAEELRQTAHAELCREFGSGQVLTPQGVAGLMASMLEASTDEASVVRLLEPGAGTGILIAAALARFIDSDSPADSFEAVAVESDPNLVPFLKRTLSLCESAALDAGVDFNVTIREHDFLAVGAASVGQGRLDRREEGMSAFTHVIMNPPYRKINRGSPERRLLSDVGIEVSNLYAGFVALGAMMLTRGGQLVAITPRSFCNGTYFRRFRHQLLDLMALREIYLFDSRRAAFSDAGVLQENLIFSAIREARAGGSVTIGVGNGELEGRGKRDVPVEQVIWPEDRNRVIHIVATPQEQRISEWMQGQPASLRDLGLTVSTGRVVDFRAEHLIQEEVCGRAVPLIYPTHIKNCRVDWPVAGSKPNWISDRALDSDLLLPVEPYVLVKRFTAKEERRRIVAAVFDPEDYSQHTHVGFENHLNYFHVDGSGIDQDLAYGLAAYLNTERVDRFFRQFSGHTQVNASDLRMLRYPDVATLRRAGKLARNKIDQMDGQRLDWSEILRTAAKQTAA